MRRQNRLGLALIALVILAGGVVGYFYMTVPTTSVDPDTGCPVDGASSLTAIIIDESDPISPRQQAFLRNHLEAIKEDVPKGGALEVYTLGIDAESLLTPLVSVCNPGRGGDVDPITGSRQRADKLWQEGFEQRVQKVFDRILDPDGTNWSPIFESIQSIGITALGNPKWHEKPRRLVLVSDLIQYTRQVSHYEGVGSFEAFSRTPYYQQVRTDLSGVDVTVYYLPRASQKNIQGPGHLSFWKDYFLDQGAGPGRPAFFVHVEG